VSRRALDVTSPTPILGGVGGRRRGRGPKMRRRSTSLSIDDAALQSSMSNPSRRVNRLMAHLPVIDG